MRYLLLIGVFIIIFVCCCKIKYPNDLQIAYVQTKKDIGHASVTLQQLRTYDSAHSAPGKYKIIATKVVHNKACSDAAALTLEYIAVQIPSSYSFQ